jgi:hypothetical protein
MSTQGGSDALSRLQRSARGQRAAALERDRMLFKEFSTLDEAMSWAGHVNDRGLTALLIEGDDGTCLVKQEIAAALGHR